MDNRNPTFRRRPSVRMASARRPSVRRPYDHRRPSARRPWDQRPSARRPSARRPPDHRHTSARRPSDRLPSARRPSVRRPSDHRRPSVRPPSPRSPASLESFSSTYTSEYYSSDEDEASEHGLSTTIKTNVQMEKDGLGFIVIQNGPYLQLTGLVEKSAAARDGKLQAGDVLLKIGHANVLGWTLRELRQLLQGTPIGTVLQIQAYRDFLALPSRWKSGIDHIPEKKGADIYSDADEESWTSSEGADEYDDYSEETDSEDDHPTVIDRRAVQEEEDDVHLRAHHDKTVHYEDLYEEPRDAKARLSSPAAQAFRSLPPSQLQWISRDWHFLERKRHTFTVGSDIGCDIMIHNDHRGEMDVEGLRSGVSADVWNAESDVDDSVPYLRWSSPYWTMPKANISSSSSSSSLSDVFWLTDSAEEGE